MGIDFGTTYSAAAWAETSNPNQIEIIKNWPTSGQLVGSQAPSEIAYPDGDTSNFSWGYNISPRARKVSNLMRGEEASDTKPKIHLFRSNGSSLDWRPTTMYLPFPPV